MQLRRRNSGIRVAEIPDHRNNRNQPSHGDQDQRDIRGGRLVQRSTRRRRLTRNARNSVVDACPDRRSIGPNGRRRPRDFWIVQSPGANKNKIWTRFRFAEELCAEDRTKAPMHLVAAIGDALKIGELPFDRDRSRWKTDIHDSAAGPEVLA